MAQTTFTGPVTSLNGFTSGTSSAPVSVTTATNISSAYGTTSATTDDTRLFYEKLTFTSTGSGETLRAFSVVTGADGATAGTINGAHISMEVDGSGTISGAGNAIRATLGGTNLSQGGTLAVIQADTNYTGSVTTPATSSFIRFTDSGTGTGKINNLFNVATSVAATVAPTASAVATVSKAVKVMIGGTAYYIPAYASYS